MVMVMVMTAMMMVMTIDDGVVGYDTFFYNQHAHTEFATRRATSIGPTCVIASDSAHASLLRACPVPVVVRKN